MGDQQFLPHVRHGHGVSLSTFVSGHEWYVIIKVSSPCSRIMELKPGSAVDDSALHRVLQGLRGSSRRFEILTTRLRLRARSLTIWRLVRSSFSTRSRPRLQPLSFARFGLRSVPEILYTHTLSMSRSNDRFRSRFGLRHMWLNMRAACFGC